MFSNGKFLVLCSLFGSFVSAVKYLNQAQLFYSTKDLVHESYLENAPTEISAVALTQHIYESLGLPAHTLNIPDPLPLVPDVFQHTQAYGLVLIDGLKDQRIEFTKSHFTFHQNLQLKEDNAEFKQIPSLIANGLRLHYGKEGVIMCSGHEICSHLMNKNELSKVEELEEKLWLKYQSSFDRKNKQDVAFLKDYAKAQAIVNYLKESKQVEGNSHDFYVISFSNVQSFKVNRLQESIEMIQQIIQEFEQVLHEKYQYAGFQLLQFSENLKQSYEMDSMTAFYGRRLQEEVLNVTAPRPNANGTVNLPSTNATNLNDTNTVDLGLKNATDNSTALTMDDIASYQIILWTSLLLVLILFATIVLLCGMDNKKDSLLYAKFITDASHRKTN